MSELVSYTFQFFDEHPVYKGYTEVAPFMGAWIET